MDEDKCAMCGLTAVAGRLYCSDRCREADGVGLSSVPRIVGSRPLSAGIRPPPINTYSYPTRRSSRSFDVSTSDLDSSAASTSSATRTSPPSSLADEDEEDEIEPEKFYARLNPLAPMLAKTGRRQSTTGCTPLRLNFARRPSQTNSRTLIPAALTSTNHRRHASMADSIPQPPKTSSPARTQFPRSTRSPTTLTAPGAWRMTAVVEAVSTKRSHLSPRSSRQSLRASLPASFSRVLGGVAPMPSPPLQPLVTITNVDTTGTSLSVSVSVTPLASAAPSSSMPLDRNWSQSTVRVGRTTTVRPLYNKTHPQEDSAVDGDDSEVERVVEPLRGRARTRTRRESTTSAVRRRDESSPRGRPDERTHGALVARTRAAGSRTRSP